MSRRSRDRRHHLAVREVVDDHPGRPLVRRRRRRVELRGRRAGQRLDHDAVAVAIELDEGASLRRRESERASSLSSASDRRRFDLDPGALRQGRHRERRAGRRRVGHALAVHRVDRREVADVGEEDRRLHDVRPGAAAGVEHGREVLERALRLRLDAASTSSPVAGSRPTWPEQKTRSSVKMPWLYGPMAAGRRPSGSRRGSCSALSWSCWPDRRGDDGRDRRRDGDVAVADGRADGLGGRGRLVERRIERPGRRAGAGLADRAAEQARKRRAGTGAAQGRGSPPRRRGRWRPPGRPPARRAGPRSGRRRAPRRGAPTTSGWRPGRPSARRRRRPRRPPAVGTATDGVTRSTPGGVPRIGRAACIVRRAPPRGPGRPRGRTGRPSRARPAMSSRARGSSSAPHASRAASSAAAASLLPPASPAATGIRLSSRTARAGPDPRRGRRARPGPPSRRRPPGAPRRSLGGRGCRPAARIVALDVERVGVPARGTGDA